MRRPYRTYPAEFRRQILDLVAAGRTPAELAEEYGVTAASIRLWLRRARAAGAQGSGGREGLSAEEKEELRRLRRENAVLRQEKEILKKAAAWFARESSELPGESTSS